MERHSHANIVVTGEASESDEDDVVKKPSSVGDIDVTLVPQHLDPRLNVSVGNIEVTSQSEQVDTGSNAVNVGVKLGVVVSGEASESDDENEIVTRNGQILPLNVNKDQNVDVGGMISEVSTISSSTLQREQKHRYKSLLHSKLRERNISLRKNLVDVVHQTYVIAARNLHSLTQQLQKSHIAMQEVSYQLRSTSNIINSLEKKVNIVRGCNILPDINILGEPNLPSETV